MGSLRAGERVVIRSAQLDPFHCSPGPCRKGRIAIAKKGVMTIQRRTASPAGVPRAMYVPTSFHFIQTSDYFVILRPARTCGVAHYFAEGATASSRFRIRLWQAVIRLGIGRGDTVGGRYDQSQR